MKCVCMKNVKEGSSLRLKAIWESTGSGVEDDKERLLEGEGGTRGWVQPMSSAGWRVLIAVRPQGQPSFENSTLFLSTTQTFTLLFLSSYNVANKAMQNYIISKYLLENCLLHQSLSRYTLLTASDSEIISKHTFNL